jgi:uncharacterized ion transporter superfamily protein YfcC
MITTSQIVLYKNLHACKIKKKKEKRAATISKGFFKEKFQKFRQKSKGEKKKKKLSLPHVD